MPRIAIKNFESGLAHERSMWHWQLVTIRKVYGWQLDKRSMKEKGWQSEGVYFWKPKFSLYLRLPLPLHDFHCQLHEMICFPAITLQQAFQRLALGLLCEIEQYLRLPVKRGKKYLQPKIYWLEETMDREKLQLFTKVSSLSYHEHLKSLSIIDVINCQAVTLI